MKRRGSIFLFIFIVFFSFGMPAFVQAAGEDPSRAADAGPRVIDMAGLLNEADHAELLSKLDGISERQRLDVVVVTVNGLDGKSSMQYADDFYDHNGYGYGGAKDGVLLLVSMADRDWWISTTGYGITAFTDAGMGYISERFLPALSNGDYMEAFTCFADCCDEFITKARAGRPYDIGHMPKEPFRVGFCVCAALGIGLIFSLIVTAVMKGRLKSVRRQPGASSYVKSGSMNITESRELFLYSNLRRREKPKNNSSGGGSRTHTSSSGRSHGGRGGKF